MNKKDFGVWGEEQAYGYLQKHGHEILERNYRVKQGEIDIISRIGNILCFVEVKTRKNSDFGLPCEAVNYLKQKKIRMVSAIYLSTHTVFYDEIRFDIIEVYSQNQEIVHIEGAF